MGYTPIVQPENSNIDRSLSESPPTTPRLLGAATEFMESMKQLVIPDLTLHAANLYTEKFNPGKFLSNDQIKESYPLVADQFKDGGHEHSIMNANDLKSKAVKNQFLLNNMQPGALSSLSRGAGFLTANLLSPVNYITGMGVEKTVGKLSELALSKVSETNEFAKIAARGAFGALEGGAIITPMAMSTRDYYNQLNMPLSKLDTALMIGTGSGLGGILRTVTGFKSPISKDSHTNASVVAADQLAKGKKVSTGLIIKDGQYRERTLEEPTNVEALNVIKNEMQEKSGAIDKQLSDEKEKFNTLTKDRKNTIPHDQITDGKDIISNMQRIGKVEEDFRRPKDKEFINNLPDTDEIKAAITYNHISPDELKPHEQTFMSKFNAGKEDELIEKNIEARNKDLEKTKNKLKKIPKENKEEISTKKEEITETKRKLKNSKERLKMLKRLKNEPKKISESRKAIKELSDKKIALDKIITDTKTHIDLVNSNSDPVNISELRNEANRINSWEGNQTTHLSDFSKAERENAEPAITEQDLLDSYEKTVQNLKDAGELDNVKGNLEELEVQEDKHNKINKALKDFVVCQTGGKG